MKKLVLFIAFSGIISLMYSQTVVTDTSGYTTADGSAVLDVRSTTKGLLLPRLTSTQKAAVSSPADGLILYQSSGSTGLYLRNNGSWEKLGTYTLPSLTSGSVLFSDGSTISQDNSNFYWDNTNKRLGIGTTTPTYSLSFGGNTSRSLWVERNSTTSGSNLTIEAGGAQSGGTDLSGGNLILKSGITTGTGRSDILFQTPETGTSGNSDNSFTSRMIIWGNGSVSLGTSTWLTNVTLYAYGTGNTNQQTFYSLAENGTAENRAIWGKSQVTGSSSTNNYGIVGEIKKPLSGTTSGVCFGVYGIGEGSSWKNYGVYGESKGTGSENVGVYGISQTTNNVNYGVWGAAYGSGTSTNYGVQGYSFGGTTGYAFYATATNATTNYAFYGSAGIFKNSGSVELPIVAKTSTYTAAATDYTIYCDNSSGMTIDLPAASGCSGRIYIIKNVGSSGTITVDGNSGETIDGATTYSLSTQWSSIMIQSNGSNWLILSKN